MNLSRPYLQRSYNARIGLKLVALKDESLVHYESGRTIGGENLEVTSRNLYYWGVEDTTVSFLWQTFENSAKGARSIEKTSYKYSRTSLPFSISVHGFLIQIHEADQHHVTYTIVDAKPLDMPKEE